MEQEFLSFKDIIKYINRFKYLIFLILLLTLLTTYYYTKKQPKIYKSTVSIIINYKANSPVREINDNYYTSFQEYESFYNTEYERLKSYQLADRVVENFNLENDPYFREIKLKMGEKDIDIAKILQSMIQVSPLENSNKVLLSVVGKDPKFITNLANFYAESYKEHNLVRKTEHLKKSIKWLKDRVDESDKQVIKAEENLFKFKKDNKILLTSSEDKRNVIIQRLYTLEDRYNKTKIDRIEAEVEYRYIKKIKKLENIKPFIKDATYSQLEITYLLKRNELEKLFEKYKEENPKIISLKTQLKNIKQQMDQILLNYKKYIEKNYKTLYSKEKKLFILKEKTTEEALQIEQNELLYKQNKRIANAETDIYKMLLTELKKNNLKLLLQTNNIEILDKASPSNIPIKPNLKLNMVVGTLLSFIISFIMIIIILFFDKTIKTREDIEESYNLTYLGHLPKDVKVVKPKVSYKELYSINAPRSSFAENCRSITTNIELTNGSDDKDRKTFLVTSPGPMEGKTTIATNLAATLSDQGLKIVVIDTDLRKPRLHKVFDDNNDIGLTNYISGNKTLDQIIKKTELENLSFISAGPIPPNAIQIIKHPKFLTMIEELKRKYDKIIFDSPPTSAVSDPLIISKKVDGVVIIVKYNATNKHYLNEAKLQFQSVNSDIIGVVLNQADSSKISYYSYKKYDYYYYGKNES